MMHELTGVAVMLAAVSVESFAQLFLKLGAAGAHGMPSPGPGEGAFRSLPSLPARVWLALGILAYGLEILLYTAALYFLDVSVAFPLGSLCFVGVALLSRVFLKEAVGPVRWLGVACILAGAVFVAL